MVPFTFVLFLLVLNTLVELLGSEKGANNDIHSELKKTKTKSILVKKTKTKSILVKEFKITLCIATMTIIHFKDLF